MLTLRPLLLLAVFLLGIGAYFGNSLPTAAQLGTALRILQVQQGGTGSSTLSGVLAGNGTSAIKTVVIGSNMTWDGTTLNSTGGSASLSGGSANTLTYWTSGTEVGATSSPTVGYITATSTTGTSSLYGYLNIGKDLGVSTDDATEATPRVFGLTNLSSGEAARFQFGDEHNALQNAYAKDQNLYAYWALVLTGGRQNYSTNFQAMPFSKTTNVGVLVKSDSYLGNDPASEGTLIDTFGIMATTSQWTNLTSWRDPNGATMSLVDYLGHFTIGSNATSSYALNVAGTTNLLGAVSMGTVASGTWNGTALTDAYVSDTITASNYTPLSSYTAFGDIVYGTGAGTTATLPANNTSVLKFLSSAGDGANPTTFTWQTVPGAGSYTYYLYTASTSPISYLKALNSQDTTAMTGYTTGTVSATTTIRAWMTASGTPGVTVIPEGMWEVHMDVTKTGTKGARVFADVFKYNGTAETLLFTTQNSQLITGTDTGNPEEVDLEVSTSTITLASTDRIGVRWYAIPSGVGTGPTITAYVAGATLSRITLPSNTLSVENFVPYTGATKSLDLGTYNITAANASTTHLSITGNSYVGTVKTGTWNGTALTDAYVDDTITASNYLSLASWYATTSHPYLGTLSGLMTIGSSSATTTAAGKLAASAFGIIGKFFADATKFVVSVASTFVDRVTFNGAVEFFSTFAVGTSTNPTMTNANNLAINTTAASSSLRYYDGTAERVLSPIVERSFSFASSTLDYMGAYGAAGTTTILLMNSDRPFTLTDVYCKTDAGTTSIQFTHGTNAADLIMCGPNGAEDDNNIANNTWTRREDFKIDIGSTIGTPSNITVTAGIRTDAD